MSNIAVQVYSPAMGQFAQEVKVTTSGIAASRATTAVQRFQVLGMKVP